MCFSSSRSGKRLKKTRKYDIITTPAERVEMAPLNEEDDEDEDSTVFDIKYRYRVGTEASSWALRRWGGGWLTLENNMRPGVVSVCPCALVTCLTLGHSVYGGDTFDPLLEHTAPRKPAEKCLQRCGYSHFPQILNAGEIHFA